MKLIRWQTLALLIVTLVGFGCKQQSAETLTVQQVQERILKLDKQRIQIKAYVLKLMTIPMLVDHAWNMDTKPTVVRISPLIQTLEEGDEVLVVGVYDSAANTITIEKCDVLRHKAMPP